MLENQQLSKPSGFNRFLEVVIRMITALAAAIVTPAVVFTIFLIFYFTFGALNDPTLIGSEEIIEDGIAYGFLVSFFMGFAALMVSAMYIIFLGFPASIIGWRFGFIRWWTCTLVGFFLGGLPLALLELSRGKGSYTTVGNTPLVVDGVFTQAGWIDFIQKVGFLGLLGATGGFAFWLVWRFFDPNRNH